MTPRRRWFRDQYTDAIWATPALRPNEKLVALAFADHAGTKQDPDNAVTWVAWTRLSERTGIRSKDALNRATRGLLLAGWLEQASGRRQHYSPRYRLTIPDTPEVRAAYVWDETDDSPEVRETDV